MKIKDLIELLQGYDGDIQVVKGKSGYGCYPLDTNDLFITEDDDDDDKEVLLIDIMG